MKNIIVISFLFVCNISFAQEKEEREKRISEKDFPRTAYNLAQPILKTANKVKYFYETDGEKKSFEVKFKYNKKRYSCEFDEFGNLEDIEVEIEEKDIAKATLFSIEKYLNSNFDRWKIEKTQIQYIGGNAEEVFQNSIDFKRTETTNYELIIATKTQGTLTKFETLFNNNGDFILKRKVVRRSYDFLLF